MALILEVGGAAMLLCGCASAANATSYRYNIFDAPGASTTLAFGINAHKTNTFSDFIAAARRLAEKGYTAEGRIVAQGASAGAC